MNQVTTSMPSHPFEPDSFIGAVSVVTPSAVQVLLAQPSDSDGKSENERRSSGGNVGEYVSIKCGGFAIFGQLREVKAREDSGSSFSESGEINLQAIGFVELLSTVVVETGEVCPGIMSSPRVGDKVYVADPEFVRYVVENRRSYSNGDEGTLLLNFAKLTHSRSTAVSFTPEKMFGRHLAVLGATGGGKSWSVARIIEEGARLKSKIILFDATGEFRTLSWGTRHVHLGYDPDPREDSVEVVLPYFHLTEGDLFAIFKPAGQSQAPKLSAAMNSLKLARMSTGLAPDGTIQKAHKSKVQYEKDYQRFIAEIESPYSTFNIHNLTRQIQNECVDPQRSPNEPLLWGGPNSKDLSFCVPLISRIHDIIQSPNLAPIFDPHGKPSLLNEIHSFLKDDSSRVLRISLQYLSFAHGCREIIANAVGRHLLDLARNNKFKKRPLLVVVDEAHQFLDKFMGEDNAIYPLDSFALIAKEGRKYSCNICISTQRPRDIPEDVLSQMGTMIVHRIINDRDRSVIERASGEIDRSAAATIPTLAPGEAVLFGIDFPIPLSIRVEAPSQKPDSSGPDFQQFWRFKSKPKVTVN